MDEQYESSNIGCAVVCSLVVGPPPLLLPPPVLPHYEPMWRNNMRVLTLAVWLCAQLLSACHSAPLQVDVGVDDQNESSNVSCAVVCSVVVAVLPHFELMWRNSVRVLTLAVLLCAHLLLPPPPF